jgi:hypothetical protein
MAGVTGSLNRVDDAFAAGPVFSRVLIRDAWESFGRSDPTNARQRVRSRELESMPA